MPSILLSLPGVPDPTAPPGFSVLNGRDKMLFDASTPETAYWAFRMPADYGSGGLTAKIQYTMATATTGAVEFECSIQADSDGDARDVDAESYGSVQSGSATVPGTAGHLDEISIGSIDDGLAAGDYVVFRLARDADDVTNDTAAGDAEVIAVTLEYS